MVGKKVPQIRKIKNVYKRLLVKPEGKRLLERTGVNESIM
jgi:hypothetical protein